ncbi:MAG: DUF1993 domain-containing protein [Erythrobacter sp.]
MSYATAALATYTNMLGTLAHLVAKAGEHGEGEALLEARLAEDMFPLHTQIRFTIGQVIITLNRLGDTGFVEDESDIADFTEACSRIATVRELVASTDPASWPASDGLVEFDLPNGMSFAMQAHEYIRDWAMPQFYFHLMTTYSILRSEGLQIGKADYVPFMMKYLKAPATA